MPAHSTRARTVLVAVLVPALCLLLLPPAGAAAQTPPPSPFQGKTLYVDPQSAAARDVAAMRAADPTAARALERISTRSQADWFGDWNPDVKADVAARVGTITRAGAYPVLVAYDIPMRDCGSYSGGGAPSGAAYLSWIDAVRAGIGSAPAAVILEPDALALLDCLTPAAQIARLGLLREAVKRLTAGGNVAVYLDAGHASWVPPDVMASRLISAGVAARAWLRAERVELRSDGERGRLRPADRADHRLEALRGRHVTQRRRPGHRCRGVVQPAEAGTRPGTDVHDR